MLVLMLFSVGCRTPQPSVQGTGNAILITLPAGTKIELDKKSQAALVNEWADGKTLTQMKLATPAYIYERDLRELEQLRIIEELKLKK